MGPGGQSAGSQERALEISPEPVLLSRGRPGMVSGTTSWSARRKHPAPLWKSPLPDCHGRDLTNKPPGSQGLQWPVTRLVLMSLGSISGQPQQTSCLLRKGSVVSWPQRAISAVNPHFALTGYPLPAQCALPFGIRANGTFLSGNVCHKERAVTKAFLSDRTVWSSSHRAPVVCLSPWWLHAHRRSP